MGCPICFVIKCLFYNLAFFFADQRATSSDTHRHIIMKHNYNVKKVEKMLIRDFTNKEQEAAENAIGEF